MILRCEDPSFHCAASIKSIYSTKPVFQHQLLHSVITVCADGFNGYSG
nr:hypothetical protein [Candidatus Symbiopectobacterium sp.]